MIAWILQTAKAGRPWPSSTLGLARLGVVLCLACAVGGGCKTPNDARSDDLVSIIIRGASEEEIRHAMIAVFTSAGYQTGFSTGRDMVFERKASATSNVLYGGWLDSESGMWERVRLTILPSGADDRLVGCNAYLVSDHNEGFFEQEKKRSKIHANAYRKLLLKAQARLEQGVPAPPP